MVTMKCVLWVNCLDLGDELAERLLVEFQDTSKVTHYYVNESDTTEEILKKNLWNPEIPKKYAWRQNVRRCLTTIE